MQENILTSAKAGIKGQFIGFGFGCVEASDLNQDRHGWLLVTMITSNRTTSKWIMGTFGTIYRSLSSPPKKKIFFLQKEGAYPHIFFLGLLHHAWYHMWVAGVLTTSICSPAVTSRNYLGPELYEQMPWWFSRVFYHQQMRNMLQWNQVDEAHFLK